MTTTTNINEDISSGSGFLIAIKKQFFDNELSKGKSIEIIEQEWLSIMKSHVPAGTNNTLLDIIKELE